MSRAGNPRTRKAWRVRTRSHPEGLGEFAPSASAARAKVISDIRDAWGCSFKDALCEVGGVYRDESRDIQLPPRHPLTASLDPRILHCVVHAYGGRGLKAGYRDHFYTSADDWVLRAGLYHGLFKKHRCDKRIAGQSDMIMYVLTDLGRAVAAGEVETYPRGY